MLIRIVKNWTYPDMFRQTPGCSGVWDDVRFTFDPVDECDGLLVLNDLREEVTVRCPAENIWAVYQEPYLPDFMPWMKENHSRFSRVYTNCAPNAHSRYRAAHPMVPWHVGMSYDELISDQPRSKDDRIIWVTSSVQVFPGHYKRLAFYQFLTEKKWWDLDICGRGIRPVADKWDVLACSRYAIAVENNFGDNYWTEKIADCWLANTLPFYYGCPNLEDYFPVDSFVRIDLADFAGAARTIRQMVDSGEYERRLPAIREARDLILNRYQFFPFMVNELKNSIRDSSVSTNHLSAFRQHPLKRLRNHCYQMYHLYRARKEFERFRPAVPRL